MSRPTIPFRTLCLVVLCILAAGCSTPLPPAAETGSVQVTSTPPGAEVYLDNEYHGTTPVTISAVPVGSHAVEVRGQGYELWSSPVTVTNGDAVTLFAVLVTIPATLPVTFAPTVSPTVRTNLPQIHVDGYWTYPQGRDSKTNPVPLLVHTDAFNVGNRSAREVTVVANFYDTGRLVCWNTIYLGTLESGGHVVKDTMVSCTLPSGLNSQDLVVRFENLVVSQ